MACEYLMSVHEMDAIPGVMGFLFESIKAHLTALLALANATDCRLHVCVCVCVCKVWCLL
jgi:hypothetical protein